ncbi:MAG: hybrid sensor histidine kinase/response regulator [Woeseiaceae bacterium]
MSQIDLSSLGRIRDLFENFNDPILIIENGKIVECNQATIDMLGFESKDSLLARHPADISPEFQPDGQRSVDKANRILDEIDREPFRRFEWIHVSANGEEFPVEVSLAAMRTTDGVVLQCMWRDVSERKQLENELQHAQKMDVVGKLAGGVAHDFNNQLVPILGYSDLLATSLTSRPELRQWALEIQRAATSASTLVDKLLAFSRKEVLQPVNQDIDEVVHNLSGILGKLIGEDFIVTIQNPGSPLWVRIGLGDIEQIVLNLATNARDAMQPGGEITINLSLVERSNRQFARLLVSDDGAGMDSKTLSLIFEPFFTTKELGSGTGLGMSTVYRLVTKVDGTIEVRSTVGQGSEIEVLLPIVDAYTDDDELSKTGVLAASEEVNDRHILVVEDNEQVALFIRHCLGNRGFQISEASNGAEALESLESKIPDLILTDVVMSELTGPQMVEKIVERGIEVPVIFMTGYADDRLLDHGIDVDTSFLLRKPFTFKVLFELIEKALASADKYA